MSSLSHILADDLSAIATSIDPREMIDRVEARIIRRTGGQVRDLYVELVGERIVLRGRSRTYHIKQLAQEAALDETGSWPPLVNEIEVF